MAASLSVKQFTETLDDGKESHHRNKGEEIEARTSDSKGYHNLEFGWYVVLGRHHFVTSARVPL